MSEKREEEANHLISKYGIPQSEEEVEDILKESDTIDNCLLTYASMLCEQTPEGNEYVDELIVRSMQNCEPEHIDRLLGDFRTYIETINDRTETRYNPSDKGINWQKFAGKKISAEPVPINLRRRERTLIAIFKGIVRNPNIKIQDLLRIMGSRENVTQQFTDTQFAVLQEALSAGESVFTKEELIEGSEKWIGVKTAELQEKLVEPKAQAVGEEELFEIAGGARSGKINEQAGQIKGQNTIEIEDGRDEDE